MLLKKTLLSIFALAILSIANLAQAQTTSGELRLTTSPLPINLKVSPGSSVSTPIKIKNDGTKTENLKVVLMKFKADPITGATILGERESTDAYFDWVTFSEQTFSLETNQWKTITAKFDVPSSAAFDYYYSIVFFRADQDVKPGERQTVLNGGTATMVLLTAEVPGAKKELQLDQFTVDKSIFEFLPATFTVKIKNIGNVHTIPQGNIFINKGNGKDIAVLDVNDTQGSILPNSPRSFKTLWKDAFPIYEDNQENGAKTQELKWNWADASKLRWGKYTAKLLFVYDDGKRDVPVEGEVSFWVIPWRLLVYGIAIPVLPAMLVYFFMKWRIKKANKKKTAGLNKKK